MSADLFAGQRPVRLEDLTDEPPSSVPYARCKRQPDGLYAPKIYRGSQRPPARADERGALCVIDLMGSGRFLIYDISGDRSFVRVEELP